MGNKKVSKESRTKSFISDASLDLNQDFKCKFDPNDKESLIEAIYFYQDHFNRLGNKYDELVEKLDVITKTTIVLCHKIKYNQRDEKTLEFVNDMLNTN